MQINFRSSTRTNQRPVKMPEGSRHRRTPAMAPNLGLRTRGVSDVEFAQKSKVKPSLKDVLGTIITPIIGLGLIAAGYRGKSNKLA